MRYQDTSERLAQYRENIAELRRKMRELQQSIEPEEVTDYEFATLEGKTRLSQLFGDKKQLFVIHNMGTSCPMCTLWADGFNGVLPHLADRAAFVVSSPDNPEKQQKFATSRGWRFRMVSHQDTEFAGEMGYRGDNGWLPGVSVFEKRNGKIVRVSDTSFGPGDDFASIWHFFDLLPEGAKGWRPKFKYQ
jgi:predicted dithiol-disulfide oxidoreductase (DUF899 family)